MRAGIQISSFKPLMRDESGLRYVLEEMRSFDCRVTQLQWIDKSIEAKTVSALLAEYGIVSVGVQDKAPQIFEDPSYYAAYARETGCSEVCVSGIPLEYVRDGGISPYLDELSRLTDLGAVLSYHPTRTDFAEDCKLCKMLLSALPELRLVADTCQIRDAGLDTVRFIRAYEGRIETLHCKDRDKNGELCVVGTGRTDFEPIVRECSDTGVRYLLAEQETWSGDPIDSLKRGYEYVANLLNKY